MVNTGAACFRLSILRLPGISKARTNISSSPSDFSDPTDVVIRLLRQFVLEGFFQYYKVINLEKSKLYIGSALQEAR